MGGGSAGVFDAACPIHLLLRRRNCKGVCTIRMETILCNLFRRIIMHTLLMAIIIVDSLQIQF